jgi:hypothetical protein
MLGIFGNAYLILGAWENAILVLLIFSCHVDDMKNIS